MILPDVNVLIYAFLEDADQHEAYAGWLTHVREFEQLLLPDAVIIGFLRLVTSRYLQPTPAPMARAFAFVTALQDGARVVDHTTSIWHTFGQLIHRDQQIRANLVPDAYLAAIAISHKARVATRDRGFARYPGLRWFDPAAEAS